MQQIGFFEAKNYTYLHILYVWSTNQSDLEWFLKRNISFKTSFIGNLNVHVIKITFHLCYFFLEIVVNPYSFTMVVNLSTAVVLVVALVQSHLMQYLQMYDSKIAN